MKIRICGDSANAMQLTFKSTTSNIASWGPTWLHVLTEKFFDARSIGFYCLGIFRISSIFLIKKHQFFSEKKTTSVERSTSCGPYVTFPILGGLSFRGGFEMCNADVLWWEPWGWGWEQKLWGGWQVLPPSKLTLASKEIHQNPTSDMHPEKKMVDFPASCVNSLPGGFSTSKLTMEDENHCRNHKEALLSLSS